MGLKGEISAIACSNVSPLIRFPSGFSPKLSIKGIPNLNAISEAILDSLMQGKVYNNIRSTYSLTNN